MEKQLIVVLIVLKMVLYNLASIDSGKRSKRYMDYRKTTELSARNNEISTTALSYVDNFLGGLNSDIDMPDVSVYSSTTEHQSEESYTGEIGGITIIEAPDVTIHRQWIIPPEPDIELNLYEILNSFSPIGNKDNFPKIQTSEIKNEQVRHVVDTFQTLCPYTKLCKTITHHAYSDVNSCCRECKCDINCGTECCPDFPNRYLNKTERSENVLSCVLAQYKPKDFGRENGQSISMVTQCSEEYTNAYVAERCLANTLDLDFRYNVDGFVPVTSIVSQRTFKNVHCAKCHGEKKSDLLRWGLRLGCEFDISQVISNQFDMKAELDKRNDCNIMFQYPEAVYSFLNFCEVLIDRCNISGTWDQYDSTLETACISYTSVFQSEFHAYKNVHCYLCNGHNRSTIRQECNQHHYDGDTQSSFVALLDFNNLERSKQRTSVKEKGDDCTANAKYDIVKDTCRQLLCITGMTLSGDKCVPVVQTITSDKPLVFDITLLFEQKEDNTETKSLTDMHFQLVEEGMIKLSTIHSADLNLCHAQTFVKLNQSIHSLVKTYNNTKTKLKYNDVGQLGVWFQFRASSIANMSKLISDLGRVFVSDAFTSMRNNDVMVVQVNMSQIVRHAGFDYGSMLSLNTPLWLDLGLLELSKDVYIEGTVPVQNFKESKFCKTFSALQSKPLCPKLLLSSEEFNVGHNGTSIYVIDLDGYINKSDVMYNINGDSMLVCADAYFGLMENYRQRKEKQLDSNGPVFTSLTILTMVCVSMSIVSLIITFIVYSIFPKLRTTPGKNNMALVFWLFLSQSLSLLNMALVIKTSWLCSVIGLLLHLSLLSSFAWMFVCTYHMLKVFVNIERSSTTSSSGKPIFRYTCITEAVSVTAVVITIAVSYVTTEPPNIGYGGQPCYIRDPKIILYAVAIPVAIVVVANIAMFLYVVYKINKLPDMRKNSTAERSNITIFAKLSTLTGLTWIFGFVYQFTGVLAFAYIFIILNASQGVFIMLSFVINKRVISMVRMMSSERASDTTRPSGSRTYSSGMTSQSNV